MQWPEPSVPGEGNSRGADCPSADVKAVLKQFFFKQNQLKLSKINFPLSGLFKLMGTPRCSLWHLSQQAVTNKIWLEDPLLVIWLLFCASLPAMPQCFQPYASNAVSQLLPFSSVLMAIITQMIAEQTFPKYYLTPLPCLMPCLANGNFTGRGLNKTKQKKPHQ